MQWDFWIDEKQIWNIQFLPGISLLLTIPLYRVDFQFVESGGASHSNLHNDSVSNSEYMRSVIGWQWAVSGENAEWGGRGLFK
jgi:hypothetical protein